MPDHRLRGQFGDDDWMVLQASVIFACIDGLDADDDGCWWLIDQTLNNIASELSQNDPPEDLALSVIATLSNSSLRARLIRAARVGMRENPLINPCDVTKAAGQLVDRYCVGQALQFRSSLTLLALAISQ